MHAGNMQQFSLMRAKSTHIWNSEGRRKLFFSNERILAMLVSQLGLSVHFHQVGVSINFV